MTQISGVERGNLISPPERLQAGETVRQTVGGVSVRCGKKRMPTCNELDTGSSYVRL